MWTFGCGTFGRLGHNDEQDRLVLRLLAEFFEARKIVTVATGGYQTWLRERAARFGRGDGDPPASWAWAKLREAGADASLGGGVCRVECV